MAKAKLDYEVPAHLKREFVFQTAGILPPNGLVFGFNTIQKVGFHARALGGTRVLLVTDETMVRLGYAELVAELLEKEGMKVEVYGKVDPEPHVESSGDALYEMAKRTKVDLIVGLGGGSSLDMAKLTSVAVPSDIPPLDLMTKKKEATRPAIKKILIPTTSGTGSEVSKMFVASVGKDKYFLGSLYAFPEVAIIDPGLTLSMPPRITASTGIDALSHAVESLTHMMANPWYDTFGIGGIELIAKYLRRATFNGQDLEARYYMSMGATLAMMSMSGTNGLYAHSIAYVLAMYQPTAHGAGCAVGLPYTMAFNVPAREEKLAMIARAMGENVESVTVREAARKAAQSVYDLTRDVKMPVSLKEMGFRHEDVPDMAQRCITKYPREFNPRPMSKEEALGLFEAMWEGSLDKV